jgi:hypothetical protein
MSQPVVEFGLGETTTYKDRKVVWVDGGGTAWDGFLGISTIGPGTKTESVTYAVGIDGEGGRVLLRALPSGELPERIARLRSDRDARCYWVSAQGHKLKCTCRATDTCKHKSAISHLLDIGVIKCRTTLTMG